MSDLPDIAPLSALNPDHAQTVPVLSARLSLKLLGLAVPSTLVIGPAFFESWAHQANFLPLLNHHLQSADSSDPESLARTARTLSKILLNARLPSDLFNRLSRAYHQTIGPDWASLQTNPVFPRPSDLPFAFKGDSLLADGLRHFWANLLTPAYLVRLALQPRIPLPPPLLITSVTQNPISGLVITSQPALSHKHLALIQCTPGLSFGLPGSELLGSTLTLNRESGQVVSSLPLDHTQAYVLDRRGQLSLKAVKPPFNLNHLPLSSLINAANTVHHHFLSPQRLSFALTPARRLIFYTTQPFEPEINFQNPAHLNSNPNLQIIGKGTAQNPGLVSGPYRRLQTKPSALSAGDIAVTDRLNPALIQSLTKAAGLILTQAPRADQTYLQVKDLGIPWISKVSLKTAGIKSGDIITLDAARGLVFRGGHPAFSSPVNYQPHLLRSLPIQSRPATKIFAFYNQPDADPAPLADGLVAFSPNLSPKPTLAWVKRLYHNSGNRPIFFYCQSIKDLAKDTVLSSLTELSVPTQEISLLQALISAHTQSGNSLALILSGARLSHQIKSFRRSAIASGFTRHHQRHLLLNLETPHLLLNLEKFQSEFDGFILSLDHLLPLITGFKPKSAEQTAFLITARSGVSTLLEYGLKLAHKHTRPIYLSCQHLPLIMPYLELLISQGITGFIVPPHQLSSALDRCQFAEHRLITQKPVI